MDISIYISELLYEHDCIIVPGFGGFICNYKPAEIHPVLNTVSPPAKAISFNRNLKSNDGLLINFIAERDQISFYEATSRVQSWVSSSASLLKKGEQVLLRKIGKFHHDAENNLQFVPDENVNYLKASFGLRTLTAEPVMRTKVIDFTEKFRQETKHTPVHRKTWRMAAVILLLAGIAGSVQLMWSGVEIKTLNLNEANVFNFINHIFKAEEPEIKPIPLEVNSAPVVVNDSSVAARINSIDSTITASNDVVNQAPAAEQQNTIPAQEENTLPVASSNSTHTYYIMIGAFAKEKNVEAARQRLQEKFPDSVILVEKGNRLTKLGYSAGNNFYRAKAQLLSAQRDDSSVWLMKK